MTIEFRGATPADVDTAGPLVLSSGPDGLNYVFTIAGGMQVQSFLRHAFLDGSGEFGYRNHTVATLDGAVVGIGAAYSGEKGISFMTAAARQILSLYGLCGLGVMRRGLRTERVVQPPKKDEWVLVHLGVAPAVRGRGVGRVLIEQLLAQGKAGGFHKAVLDVSVLNPRAQALYERLGFTVEAERPSTLRNEVSFVPAHRRMSRAI
ncbi:MAG: GNAT family N-acetyltransferase [Candidatus Binatia bacterium]